MAKKRYAKSPLLYVEQPGIEKPQARMQHQYQSPKKKRDDQNAHKTDTQAAYRPKKSKSSWKQQKSVPLEAEEEQALEKVDNSVEQSESTEDEDKTFKEMTIEEKVGYLTNRSPYAPTLRCLVKTDERTYRGIMVKLEDDTVFMRVGRRTSTTQIQMEAIQDIQLLGLL
ncbi:CotO family spore coat protein [Lentibacillus saliphilus]|uniref:CotO family spore coat protein n=1 Tax=Lentibacillus saliphilus TaxID=2737028 RepID=UPI001C2F3BEF|nr:CotO family spore coat protein [Lentibacillus saliphilus]